MGDVRDGLPVLVPSLRALARALTRDRDEADDLVQETLLKAIAHERLWRGGSLKAWAVTILLNAYRSRLRKQRRLGPHDPLDEASVATVGTPGDSAELRAVEKGIALLPPEQREVLLLVALEGLSYRETADALGVPIGTVMSRLSRARAALRAFLDGDSVVPFRRIP
jgi:RNA polymerase sigma-70 factor (ECF subfamily)